MAKKIPCSSDRIQKSLTGLYLFGGFASIFCGVLMILFFLDIFNLMDTMTWIYIIFVTVIGISSISSLLYSRRTIKCITKNVKL